MWEQLLTTPLGKMYATWSRVGLYSISFGNALRATDDAHRLQDDSLPQLAMWQRKLELALSDYFESGTICWQLDQFDWSGVSPFHRLVLERCFAIPAGKTLSYGELAAQAGSPKAARAVGGAMARNRWPIIIPCHRVMGGSGKLIGYSGVGGTKTKRWLLDLEAHREEHDFCLTSA